MTAALVKPERKTTQLLRSLLLMGLVNSDQFCHPEHAQGFLLSWPHLLVLTVEHGENNTPQDFPEHNLATSAPPHMTLPLSNILQVHKNSSWLFFS